jgi:SsrA-binding protein
VARNPRARHDYHILDTLETGIVLTGTEVKSLRQGKASIKEAYGLLRNGEVWLEGMHITPYEQGNRYNHEPIRSRKLLMHRREIARLIGAVEQKGLALVPLELFFGPRGVAKVILGVGRGKKAHDRREDIKRRIADREMARALRGRG